MIRILIYLVGFGSLGFSILLISCNSVCEDPELHDLKKKCGSCVDTLLITDFEIGSNPTEAGGNLSAWFDELSNINVEVSYATLGGGAWNSQFYAMVEISNNNGNSPAGFSGGGYSGFP